MLTVRGLGRVLGDLAALGFDAEGGVLGAHHAGAPHYRDRIWIYARDPDSDRESAQPVHDEAPGLSGMGTDAHGAGGRSAAQRECGRRDSTETRDDGETRDAWYAHCEIEQSSKPTISRGENRDARRTRRPAWWSSEPGVHPVAHGVANRVDRIRTIGNGQVPAVAALAFETLSARLPS
jgi:DNA (cytosine-5)-methyltransferase 1